MNSQQMLAIAVDHHQAGRLVEAHNLYRLILAQQPNANIHNNLGHLLFLLGKNEEAIAEVRQAIVLRPDLAEPHNNLGVILAGSGRTEEAIGEYRAAIALDANHARALSNLGNALRVVGQAPEAIACYRKALSIDPNYAEAHSNLGALLNELGNVEEAILCHRRAITLRPGYAEGHSNLGSALGNIGKHQEAIEAQRQAISLQPQFAAAHVNLGLELLMRGDFSEGWAEYEWRTRVPGFSGIRKNCPQPLWNGSDLGERVLLLYGEQGLGDAIQFVRYLPLIRGRVLLEVQRPLVRLMSSLGVSTADRHDGGFDVHLPLMSLPMVLRKFDPLPMTEPYIRADDGLRQQIGERKGLKVGLAWAGSATHKNDRNRSISLAKLGPLMRDDVEFYSLQVGSGAEQAEHPPAEIRLTNLTRNLRDFADTAALIDQLDLVITVDTAVAHLAGAMGKPIWVLLPEPADWRWMLEREDSPWYPTMRLLRQQRAGDWDEVITRVARELEKFKLP
jgi:Flp pilus assembly protein TadD